MQRWTLFAVTVGAVAVYLYWPPPKVSQGMEEWHRHGENIDFHGHRIFYRDKVGVREGGPVLVCLHGFPTSSYDWVKILPALKKRFGRIILPDFIGFGFSDKPMDHQYSLLTQADIIEEVLRENSITSIHLLSHDYGDTVAQELLHRFEMRKKQGTTSLVIESLCLLNGGIFPETNFPTPIQKLAVLPGVGVVFSRLIFYQVFRVSLGRVFGPDRQPTESEMRDFWANLRFKDGQLAMNKLLGYMSERWLHRERWVGVLETTSVPVHTIYGPADVVNPPSPFIDHYRKTLPRATLTVLPEDVGHYPQWEHPDAVSSDYGTFLDMLDVLPLKSEGGT